MTISIPESVHETARIILLDRPSLMEFSNRLREATDAFVTTAMIGKLWEMYVGFDGRQLPTHDIETGWRI